MADNRGWELTELSTGRNQGTFSPTVYEMAKEAARRIGFQITDSETEFFKDAIQSINFIQNEFSVMKAYLPSIYEFERTLEVGDEIVTLPEGTIELVVVTYSYPGAIAGNGSNTNIKMTRIDVDQDAQRVTGIKGAPSQYWYDRAAGGHNLRLYYTADQNYKLTARIQMQPKTLTQLNESIETTPIWYSAIAAKLATAMAVKYNAQMVPTLMGLEQKCVDDAVMADNTRTSVRIKVSSPFRM